MSECSVQQHNHLFVLDYNDNNKLFVFLFLAFICCPSFIAFCAPWGVFHMHDAWDHYFLVSSCGPSQCSLWMSLTWFQKPKFCEQNILFPQGTTTHLLHLLWSIFKFSCWKPLIFSPCLRFNCDLGDSVLLFMVKHILLQREFHIVFVLNHVETKEQQTHTRTLNLPHTHRLISQMADFIDETKSFKLRKLHLQNWN